MDVFFGHVLFHREDRPAFAAADRQTSDITSACFVNHPHFCLFVLFPLIWFLSFWQLFNLT